MPVINHQNLSEIEMRAGIRGKFLASGEQGTRSTWRVSARRYG
jgi:hypothetical protein